MCSNNTRKDITPAEHGRECCYSINEIADLFGVNAWTIRMWGNRFDDVLKPNRNANGELLFTSAEVDTIGTICNFVRRRGTTFADIRRHLNSRR